MMGYGDMVGYGWIWMTIGIAVWVAVVALVARAVVPADRHRSVTVSAEEILRRRYANGELSDIEFESAQRTLRDS
ncbi:MAG: SHOCT domain-containing protein [Dehalococcoidia bacterium]